MPGGCIHSVTSFSWVHFQILSALLFTGLSYLNNLSNFLGLKFESSNIYLALQIFHCQSLTTDDFTWYCYASVSILSSLFLVSAIPRSAILGISLQGFSVLKIDRHKYWARYSICCRFYFVLLFVLDHIYQEPTCWRLNIVIIPLQTRIIKSIRLD